MKKNVKILGAAAAALLAVAPVVASATTANASTVTVNAGAKPTTDPAKPALNINATIDATAGVTTAAQAAKSVKLSIDNGGIVNGMSTATVQILGPDGQAVPVDQHLQAGVKYQIEVTGVYFTNLLTGKQWSLGDASFNGSNTAWSLQLMNKADNNTFKSAPFYITDANDATQPYFSDAKSGQLTNGAVAYAGTNGEGLSDTNPWTAASILSAAKDAVSVHNTGLASDVDQKTAIITSEQDINSQLAAQKVSKNSDSSYNTPANGFHVTLTAINRKSNKTVTVVVPFAGHANTAGFPTIAFDVAANGNVPSDYSGYTSNFAGLSVKGASQSTPASRLVRNVKVGDSFTNTDAVTHFGATTADNGAKITVAVLNNPVNTRIPGRYTVTIEATDWTTGKTSQLSYTVQVGDADANYQNVNYPAAYGVNIWSISGDTVSFTGDRQAGQTSVATYGTKTVNGVSYTEIGSANSNRWIQTQYLGNHSTEKPSNGETAMRGVAKVTFNGKGAVRLLNAEGHYVDQYVKKGSSFKVWAEKTVNGQHLYRIGSQSQWIPAKYVSVK